MDEAFLQKISEYDSKLVAKWEHGLEHIRAQLLDVGIILNDDTFRRAIAYQSRQMKDEMQQTLKQLLLEQERNVRNCGTLSAFLVKTGELWSTHKVDLLACEREFEQKLEELAAAGQTSTENSEMQLDGIANEMRTAADGATLNEALETAYAILVRIETSM